MKTIIPINHTYFYMLQNVVAIAYLFGKTAMLDG
jgi:hypothetical protein